MVSECRGEALITHGRCLSYSVLRFVRTEVSASPVRIALRARIRSSSIIWRCERAHEFFDRTSARHSMAHDHSTRRLQNCRRRFDGQWTESAHFRIPSRERTYFLRISGILIAAWSRVNENLTREKDRNCRVFTPPSKKKKRETRI